MSTHHMSLRPHPKKTKLADLDGYKGHEDVPQNVTHVRFHPSVVDVDEGAFEDLTELREVILNDGLREIGQGAFARCSLQSINIPSTVEKIGYTAFIGCHSLRGLVLNEGLKEIGEFAFQMCTSLQSITIPSTVTYIGDQAFYGCESSREVVLHNGIIRIGKNVFRNCNSLRSVELPSTVTEIDNYAFANCSSLEEVVLNEGLKKIGGNVFHDCSSLERIIIPSTVIEIDKFAFWNCTNLREVVIERYEGVQYGDNVFRECSLLGRFSFSSLSTRLENIIQAGQRGIGAKMDDIPGVEWRSGELVIPAIHRRKRMPWGMETVVEVNKEKLDKVERLIVYYEIKEATSLFELALWKVKIDQTNGDSAIDRGACRIEVPGPVKDTILQYIRND